MEKLWTTFIDLKGDYVEKTKLIYPKTSASFKKSRTYGSALVSSLLATKTNKQAFTDPKPVSGSPHEN